MCMFSCRGKHEHIKSKLWEKIRGFSLWTTGKARAKANTYKWVSVQWRTKEDEEKKEKASIFQGGKRKIDLWNGLIFEHGSPMTLQKLLLSIIMFYIWNKTARGGSLEVNCPKYTIIRKEAKQMAFLRLRGGDDSSSDSLTSGGVSVCEWVCLCVCVCVCVCVCEHRRTLIPEESGGFVRYLFAARRGGIQGSGMQFQQGWPGRIACEMAPRSQASSSLSHFTCTLSSLSIKYKLQHLYLCVYTHAHAHTHTRARTHTLTHTWGVTDVFRACASWGNQAILNFSFRPHALVA